MTADPAPERVSDPLAPEAIQQALTRNATASAIVLPREDGQYSDASPDIIAILAEKGVEADYATDPMSTGIHMERHADVVLPWILLAAGAISTAGDVIGTVDGIVVMVRWFVERRPGGRVKLRLAGTRRPSGTEVRKLELTIEGHLDDASERAIRDAVGRFFS